MSINRIDLQGAVLRTSDVAQHGAQDASKISVDQNNFASQFTREIEEKLTSVNETNKTDKKEEKFDAKEKGSNEYYRDEGEKKEKKQKEEDELSKGFAGKSAEELEKMAGNMIDKNGRPIQLGLSSGFDFKI